MNLIKHSILLLCAVALAGGCQREESAPSAPRMVKIVIDTELDDTRTHINESAQRVEWDSDDCIVVFENNVAATSFPAEITSGKASFITTFAWNASSGSFTYNAVYPATGFADDEVVTPEHIELTLPTTQRATTTSFDPAADMLIAKPQVTSGQADWLTMQFKRIVAMAKLTTKGLPAGTQISEVSFTANGKALAGACCVDLNKGEITGLGGAKDSITIAYNNSIAATTPIYFNCYPTVLTAGDSFSVTITTANGDKYTKSVTLPAGRTLNFEEGDLNTFSVDFSGIAPEETNKEYKVGDVLTMSGSKGMVYAITTDRQNITWVYLFSLDDELLQWSTENVWCNCGSDKGAWNTYDPFDPRYSYADGGVRNIDNYPAFKWCMEHGEDWFLPSSKELNMMWDALSDGTHTFDSDSMTTFNNLIKSHGGEPFEQTYYWSSNETSEDMIELVAFMFNSVVCLEPYKTHMFNTRAVYRFKL